MNYTLSEQELKDLMLKSWLKAKEKNSVEAGFVLANFFDEEIKQAINKVCTHSHVKWESLETKELTIICQNCRQEIDKAFSITR